jgi:hypothetical protein
MENVERSLKVRTFPLGGTRYGWVQHPSISIWTFIQLESDARKNCPGYSIR